jgi:hypothetical protein
MRHVVGSLLPWKNSKYYIFMCVRARMFACARARACACVHVTLLIQHATRMRRIVSSFVVSLDPPYFSALSHKRNDFGEKTLLNTKRVV